MDSNSSFERQNSCDGEDLISKLPDSIIARILSFLPTTRDAVRTSVLSHRWTYLWTCITDLRFNDRKHLTTTSFINFVNRVLLHLNCIHSFSLGISRQCDYDPYYQLNDWLSAFSVRKVKKISIDGDNRCKLPSKSLFKCQYLEDLYLRRCVITVPQGACLSSLTLLSLSYININCAFSDDSKNFTLSFPSLKKYEEIACSWSGVKSVSFEVPLLEVLSVNSSKYMSRVDMVFCALHLTEFNCSVSGSMKTINLLNAPVASANISLIDFKISLQGFSNLIPINVQRLQLYFLRPEGFRGMQHSFDDIPIFATLIHLDLCNVPNQLLPSLLYKAPRLKTLFLDVPYSSKEPLSFSAVPDCFRFTLKVVRFRSFVANEQELRIAEFVLENARVLKRISFPIDTFFDYKSELAKIFSFYKRSHSAGIEFSCSSDNICGNYCCI